MKTALLAVLLGLAAHAIAAQECAQKPSDVQPNSAQPAPAPGHPLDPNDVDILTGHARGQAAATPYARPSVAYGYTQPYSFGMGERFGFHGFFFPRSGHVRAPFFGAPFGPFFFSGFAGGRR